MMISFTTDRKAPNRLQLRRERPNAEEARRYSRARNQQSLYKAASKLWLQGVDMTQAIKIVNDAVNEASSLH